MQARALAALALTDVTRQEQTFTLILPDYLNLASNEKERSFAQELCYGVMRWYYQLDFLLRNMLDKEIKPKDTDIKILILIGLYQIKFLRTPSYAAVSATVDACSDLNKHWAKKLVNALLRRYLSEYERLDTLIETNIQAKYTHPDWFIATMQNEYPEQWQAILQGNNNYPPMHLRVNTSLTSRSEYLNELQNAGIHAEAIPINEYGIRLVNAIDIKQLPNFDNGYVSVQDPAAQLVFQLLNLQKGQRVLDACAAPGGKLAHILEQMPELAEVIAVEFNEHRFRKLEQTLARTKTSATLVHNDARYPDRWWDGKLFNRILLDAPCSGTGVIRRHPEIKLLRNSEKIPNTLEIQANLLVALWPLLARGGKLLYVTCSVLKAENDGSIKQFIDNHSDARKVCINMEWGHVTDYGWQILPGENDMDGFYYACLEKT